MSAHNPPTSREPAPVANVDEARDRRERHRAAGIRVPAGVPHPFRPIKRAPRLVALFRRLFA